MSESGLVQATAYWWNKVPNFGDQLTPFLLKRFADIDATRGTISKSSIACVGSILEHVPPEWDGYVVGAGRLFEHSSLHLYTKTAKILALRGPLSAKGAPKGDYALGDPGLLANELVDVETRKYHLGLVPHWSDKELAKNPLFLQYNPIVIDPTDDPLEVVKKIGQCKKIVSSSLHGIIVADSFGIPRRFEYHPGMDKEGGMFKFRDYHASIHTPVTVGKTIAPRRFYVEDAKDQIFDALRELGQRVRQDS